MLDESGEHRRLERFNFDSKSYSLARGNNIMFVTILVIPVATRYQAILLRLVAKQ